MKKILIVVIKDRDSENHLITRLNSEKVESTPDERSRQHVYKHLDTASNHLKFEV